MTQPPKIKREYVTPPGPGMPPLEPKSRFWAKALNKVQDVIADPKVAHGARVGSMMLDIAAKIGQAKLGGPMAAAGVAVGVVDVVRTTLGIKMRDPVEEWLKEPEQVPLVSKASWLGTFLRESGAISLLEMKVVVRGEREEMECVEDGAGRRLLFRVKSDGAQRAVERTIWHDPKFDFSVIAAAVWKTAGIPFVKLLANQEGMASITPLDPEVHPYIDFVIPVAPFIEKWRKYQSMRVSRALLLTGVPGTGKTRWVKALVEKIGGRMLVIPPGTLNGNAKSEIELWVDLLRPDVVLFDDIHNATAGTDHALSVFDDLRLKHKDILVVSTINRFNRQVIELFRPGRVGRRIKFPSPSAEQKRRLLLRYMGYYHVDPASYDLDAILAEMKHEYFSHDYVRAIAEEAATMDQAELLEYTISVNEFVTELAAAEHAGDVTWVDGGAPDDEDYEDESRLEHAAASMGMDGREGGADL